MTDNLQDILIETDTLREKIYINSFKHFVKSNCERDLLFLFLGNLSHKKHIII